jgi:hypothetical protein
VICGNSSTSSQNLSLLPSKPVSRLDVQVTHTLPSGCTHDGEKTGLIIATQRYRLRRVPGLPVRGLLFRSIIPRMRQEAVEYSMNMSPQFRSDHTGTGMPQPYLLDRQYQGLQQISSFSASKCASLPIIIIDSARAENTKFASIRSALPWIQYANAHHILFATDVELIISLQKLL